MRPALILLTLGAAGPVPVVRTAWLAETDADAERQLAALPALAADGQWDELAARVEQLRTRSGGRLVRIAPRRRVTVGTACDLALLRLPPAALAAWRDRVRPRAEDLLSRGTDPDDSAPAALRDLVRDLFLTGAGAVAADRLATDAWRRGETDTARALWSRLIPLDSFAEDRPPVVRHPDPPLATAQLAARLILCDLAGSRPATARRELAVFRTRFPEATGTLAGKTGPLADLLVALAEPTDWTDAARPPRTRTLGLTASRGGVLRSTSSADAVAWARRSPAARPPDDPARPFAPASPTVHPVLWRDTLLFADADAVYALDPATGRARWPVSSAADGAVEEDAVVEEENPADVRLFPPPVPSVDGASEPDRLTPPFVVGVGPVRHTLAVAGERLFARLGPPVVDPIPGPTAAGTGTLVCLDLRREGDLLWRRTPDTWGPGDERWSVEGTPAVAGGRAFVVLRRGRPDVRLDLACLDAADGAELWRTPLGSPLPSVGAGTAVRGGIVPTVAAGRVWVPTGSGTLACCDADTGNLLWLTEYPRDPAAPPAAVTPAVCAAGSLFLTPDDAGPDGEEGLLALDADSGLPLWSLPASVVDPGRGDPEVLGVAADTLVLTGRGAAGFDPHTGELRWRSAPSAVEGITHGRGLLANDFVLLPTRTALITLDAATGEVVGELPLRTEGLTGGNLAGDGTGFYSHAAGTACGVIP